MSMKAAMFNKPNEPPRVNLPVVQNQGNQTAASTGIFQNPDLAARNVLMAAYLYYVHDWAMFSDAKYDALVFYVANNWSKLDPMRQWQLGSPEEMKASGCGFKFTILTVAAANRAFLQAEKTTVPFPTAAQWIEGGGPTGNTRYCTCAAMVAADEDAKDL